MPTTTPPITHRMHYAMFLTRHHAHHQSMPAPNPSVVPVETLVATSGEFLIDMFAEWLRKYQPEPSDCFDIRVRALIDGREPSDEAGWRRPEWRRATETIRFSGLDDELSQLRRLDPTVIAWAAGNDDPYASVEDE